MWRNDELSEKKKLVKFKKSNGCFCYCCCLSVSLVRWNDRWLVIFSLSLSNNHLLFYLKLFTFDTSFKSRRPVWSACSVGVVKRWTRGKNWEEGRNMRMMTAQEFFLNENVYLASHYLKFSNIFFYNPYLK